MKNGYCSIKMACGKNSIRKFKSLKLLKQILLLSDIDFFLKDPSCYWSIVYDKRHFPADDIMRKGVLRIGYPFINSYVS